MSVCLHVRIISSLPAQSDDEESEEHIPAGQRDDRHRGHGRVLYLGEGKYVFCVSGLFGFVLKRGQCG